LGITNGGEEAVFHGFVDSFAAVEHTGCYKAKQTAAPQKSFMKFLRLIFRARKHAVSFLLDRWRTVQL
jgi:hypothetical protein